MKKLDIVIGQKIKGYGVMNEYGEFDFIPEATGSRAGTVSLVKESENYTVSTTKNKILVHIRMEKSNGMALYQLFLTLTSEILSILRNHEF